MFCLLGIKRLGEPCQKRKLESVVTTIRQHHLEKTEAPLSHLILAASYPNFNFGRGMHLIYSEISLLFLLQIFSSIPCLVFSLSLVEHEFLILIRCSLSIIFFMNSALGDVSKSHLHIQGLPGVCICFLLGILLFCVLHFGQ